MKLKHIDDIHECPHCGSVLGFYQKVYVKGWIQDNTLFQRDFSGERPKYNSEMYDSLHWGDNSSTCFCMECNASIGTTKGEPKTSH